MAPANRAAAAPRAPARSTRPQPGPLPLAEQLEGPSGRLELGLLLAVHALLFAALNGNFDHDLDAQQYGRIAHELAGGEYVLAPHPFSQRFAVTGPAAALFRLFGPSWLTATLWPLLCSLATIACAHLAVRRTVGRRAALVAAALLATNLLQVRFCSRLLPDVVVSAFMLVAALLVERGRAGAPGRQVAAGLLTALALFGALLAKATVVWAAPFFLGLALYDLIRGRNRRLWLAFLLGTGACAAAFFGGYALLTGDPLYRLQGIEGVHNARAGFFAGGLGQFASRLTYKPLVFLLERPGFGLALLLALPAVVFAARAPRGATGGARYWSAYLIAVMGSFWLGTTSLQVYTPLYLADRFLMPFLAPLAILGSIAVTRVLDARQRPEGQGRPGLELAPLLLGALLAAALSLGDAPRRAGLYVAFGLLAALATWRARPAGRPLIALVLLVLAIPTADYAWRGDPLETPDLIELERVMVARTFAPEGPPTAVLTDPHSAFVLPFYLPAEARGRVRFLSWDDPQSAPREGERALVYVNQPRLLAVNVNWGQRIPPFARVQPAGWRPVHEHSQDEQHWIRLFEPEDPASALAR